MSKGKCQQVMEHNSFPSELKLPDGKDTLQTAQKCYQLKIQSFANVICSIHVISTTIYIISEMRFCSFNFDMDISYTPPVFLSESIVYKILDFNRSCGIEVQSVEKSNVWTNVAVRTTSQLIK